MPSFVDGSKHIVMEGTIDVSTLSSVVPWVEVRHKPGRLSKKENLKEKETISYSGV